MSADKSKSSDYKSLTPTAKNGGGASSHAPTSLKPLGNSRSQTHEKGESSQNLNPQNKVQEIENSQNLTNLNLKNTKEFPSDSFTSNLKKEETAQAEIFSLPENDSSKTEDLPYAEQQKRRKTEKKAEKDQRLLSDENWLKRNGHTFSYLGLYLFSVLVLFRPYELIPGLSFLASTAFYFALATLLIYIPTQLATEGNLTAMSTEVKAILALTFLALVTMPIAKDPPTAWAVFNDTFIKAVLMFIVMVNVLRTRRRLMGLMWISLSMAFVLSYQALDLFMKGELKAEGYRVDVEIGGMFGNPNDLALHLVTMIPLAVCLGIASKSKILKLVYFLMATLFVSANFVTYSRGGFLGLIAASVMLAWKLGRKNRLNVMAVSGFVGLLVILLAPGNYGLRILSIFIPGLDPVGSSDQRRELLERSIIVTLRNPWGIGIGNFPIVGIHNLVTHNAFTQVSSEIGLLGLLAYLIFMVSPFRKLGAIERTLSARDEHDWFYYLSIGLQASILGYMVSSFFVAVAYNWFIYYLIAYAVAFRRVYQIERGLKEEVEAEPLKEVFGWRTAENNG
ncbi:MAG TPA: O-antigen ligase family protein [Pyrinomonadaceae bacterium]|nr:O-antigen ligase family protein [Pyrinomonadaceae bacterium]